MRPIFFLIFFISYLTLSKAIDSYDAGYNLVMGPLEIYLKSGKNEIMNCYEGNKNEYEKSLETFSKRLKEIGDLFRTSFPAKQQFKDFMLWGLREMNLIAGSLKSFFKEFSSKITAGHLYDGGISMSKKRAEVENHYNQYSKHGESLKKIHPPYHNQTFLSVMDEAFQKIFEKTTQTSDNILECLESSGATYRKIKK